MIKILAIIAVTLYFATDPFTMKLSAVVLALCAVSAAAFAPSSVEVG